MLIQNIDRPTMIISYRVPRLNQALLDRLVPSDYITMEERAFNGLFKPKNVVISLANGHLKVVPINKLRNAHTTGSQQ
jgi:hypothetical protein